MQIDFHYYCVGVLAKAAGFNSEDALTIAYASQYVDNSTESELIPIETGNGILNFDPVLTTYKKIDAIQSLSWSAQKRVWIPFHFIPPKPFSPGYEQGYSFVTKPGSQFARLLVEKASKESMKSHKRRMCRIGVALHTYADSWAHQGFSGRKYQGENDVEDIRIYDRKKESWEKLKIENIIFDVLPQIGHAEAGYFPDLTFQKWKYRSKPSNKVIQRDNTEEFLEAAQDIYNILLKMEKNNPEQPIPWEKLETKIRKLLEVAGSKPRNLDKLTLPLYSAFQSQHVGLRCKKWISEFSDMFGELSTKYSYDPKAWREEAFYGDVEWDDYSREDWGAMYPRKVRTGFWESLWVNFHRAALCQRHTVLENTP